VRLPLLRAPANVLPWGVRAFGRPVEIAVGLAKHAGNKVEIFNYFCSGFPCYNKIGFF